MKQILKYIFKSGIICITASVIAGLVYFSFYEESDISMSVIVATSAVGIIFVIISVMLSLLSKMEEGDPIEYNTWKECMECGYLMPNTAKKCKGCGSERLRKTS